MDGCYHYPQARGTCILTKLLNRVASRLVVSLACEVAGRSEIASGQRRAVRSNRSRWNDERNDRCRYLLSLVGLPPGLLSSPTVAGQGEVHLAEFTEHEPGRHQPAIGLRSQRESRIGLTREVGGHLAAAPEAAV